MVDLINGRTPEEIKRWISSRATCETCQKEHEFGCEYGERTEDCQMCIDTLAYIERLEAERDAALKAIPRVCATCKHAFHKPIIKQEGSCTALIFCENEECRNISGINTGWELAVWPEPPKEE